MKKKRFRNDNERHCVRVRDFSGAEIRVVGVGAMPKRCSS